MKAEIVQVAAARAISRCLEIAAFTETPGEIDRPFLCTSARRVQQQVESWMRDAGMSVEVDAAGNLRGLFPGENESGGRLLIGSHLDTVPNAGAFDGVLGVMIGLAIVEERRGKPMPFAIELVAFSEEEGVRFGKPFLGSMALVGRLDAETLALRDRNGVSVEEAAREFGLDTRELRQAIADEGSIGFLEVHIEQGPVLDEADRALGIVDVIVGQTRLLVHFKGRANHAGTTPMASRQDALAAAAEWIVAVESQARTKEGLVATVGRLMAKPGAANVIAGEVSASLDIRHASDSVRTEAVRALSEAATRVAGQRGVTVVIEQTVEQAAVPLSQQLSDRLTRSARRAGHNAMSLSSGAGHDAMVMAERMPAAMLFLRSPGGISHHPDEGVREEDVGAAIETVKNFVLMTRDERLELEEDWCTT